VETLPEGKKVNKKGGGSQELQFTAEVKKPPGLGIGQIRGQFRKWKTDGEKGESRSQQINEAERKMK